MSNWKPLIGESADLTAVNLIKSASVNVLLRGRFNNTAHFYVTDVYQGWWNRHDGAWMRWPHAYPPTHYMLIEPLPEDGIFVMY